MIVPSFEVKNEMYFITVYRETVITLNEVNFEQISPFHRTILTLKCKTMHTGTLVCLVQD